MFNALLFQRLIKYALEGGAVALAAYYIPSRGQTSLQEVLMIALTAATVFLVLDVFAPSVGSAARGGAGFGIGANTVGFKLGGAGPGLGPGLGPGAAAAGPPALEPMEDVEGFSY